MVKNVGTVERWVRLILGAIFMLLGLRLAGWAGWLSGSAGLALLLTSTIRY